MQYLVLSRRRPESCSELDFHRRLEAESHLVQDLYQAGIVRQVWRRGDLPGICLVMEARNEEEARAALENSPLVRAGLGEVADFVPLRSFP